MHQVRQLSQKYVLLVIWSPLILTAILSVMAFHTGTMRDKAADTITHSYQFKQQLEKVFSEVKDAETSLRGYYITKDPGVLHYYTAALNTLPQDIRTLKALAQNDSSRLKEVNSIESLINQRLKILADTLELLHQNRSDELQDVMTQGEGRKLMQELYYKTAVLDNAEDNLMVTRKEILASQVKVQEGWVGALFATDLCLIIVATWVVQRFDVLRRKARQELDDAHAATEASNQAKSQFLANMSHEIRTPLNGIIGTTELMLSTPLDKDQRDYLDTIHSSGENLLTIINDVLDYSKLDSDKMDIDNHPFNLLDMLNEIAGIFGHRAKSKLLKLVYELDPRAPVDFIGDSLKIKQVLTNLVSNALKFTKQGEVRISVDAMSNEAQADGLRWMRFTVSDTGIGVPPDRIGKLFATFSQVDASTTRKYGGTGLGLAICKKLCELMGGTITVLSHVGQGTKFTVELGLKPGRESIHMVDPHLKDVRVLLLQDDPASNHVLRLFLERWGIQVTNTETVDAALVALEQAMFNIIIVDDQVLNGSQSQIQAPTAGSDFVKSLRQKYPVLPIILLTDTNAQSDERCVPLSKPIRQSLLYSTLLEILIGAPKLQQKANETTKLKHISILVADDNELNQKVTSQLFRRLGYTSDQVMDGIDVLEALKRKAYDIVFMDVQMPVMDGLEATRRIRKLSGCDKVKVIALTANALKGEREKCLEAGMDDYLSKPVKMESLKGMIEKHCIAKTE